MKQTVLFILLICVVCAGVFGQSAGDFVVNGIVLVKYQGTAKDVVIPTNLKIAEIGFQAFRNNRDITSITIPSGVTVIGDSAFESCINLTIVTIPSSITSVGNRAFFHCSRLASITIPSRVTSIGDAAFNGCKSLITVSIPSGVTDIGDLVFSFCESLAQINVDSQNVAYSSIDGVLFDKGNAILMKYPENKQGQNYVIPNGVKQIADSAFSECTNLTSIIIPDSVVSIEEYSFAGCENLTEITIPASVKEVKWGAFAYCDALPAAIRADIIKRFGEDVFQIGGG